MSYQLLKPYTTQQKTDFIVRYNHNQGLRIEETETALYALEDNEIMLDGVPIVDPEWEEKQAQKEHKRIQQLSLTKREVFLALYRAKGITPEMVRSSIQDEEAIIEFDYATEYYRFNPLIDSIGGMLGYSSADLDYLFVNKSLPKKEEAKK